MDTAFQGIDTEDVDAMKQVCLKYPEYFPGRASSDGHGHSEVKTWL